MIFAQSIKKPTETDSVGLFFCGRILLNKRAVQARMKDIGGILDVFLKGSVSWVQTFG